MGGGSVFADELLVIESQMAMTVMVFVCLDSGHVGRTDRQLICLSPCAARSDHRVKSFVDYCNSVMYGIADGLMQRLQAIQNAAARLIDCATTYRLFSGSCTGFQSANEFSSSWPC